MNDSSQQSAGAEQTGSSDESEPLFGRRAVGRVTTQRLVQRLDYSTLVPSNGAQAIACAATRAGPIDILLCDIGMPGEGGRELAAKLVELRPELGVVFMSGYASDMQELRVPGASLLQKPFRLDELAATLAEAKVAERSRSERRA